MSWRFSRALTGNKYGAKKQTVHGITFDSMREADHYLALLAEVRAGTVRALERQPAFPIEAVNLQTGEIVRIAVYRADFRYERRQADGTWRAQVDDVKGMRTATYRLKKKLVEAQYGIRIHEI